MLRFLFPREEDFFELFQNTAQEFSSVAHHFSNLLKQIDSKEVGSKDVDSKNAESKQTDSQPRHSINIIRDHETRADILINNAFKKLHKTFITPFDRYDIHRFVRKLNEAIEAVLDTAERIEIYQLKTVPDEIHDMADLIVKSGKSIHKATQSLHLLKNVSRVLEYCDEVKNLEGKGEKLLLAGVSRLFKEESDIKTLLKTKEIYEYTKFILDECDLVANILKDIVLEYS